MSLRTSGDTRAGPRERNEDDLAVRPDLGLFAVADGIGGHEGGALASRLVVGALEDFFEDHEDGGETRPDVDHGAAHRSTHVAAQRRMRAALRLARRRVLRRALGPIRDMGATVVALLVEGDHVLVTHIGDSRAYRLRAGCLEGLTCDHSLWGELRATGGDELLGPSARGSLGHVVTRAISGRARSDPDFRHERLRDGDRFLLCSDGLSNALDEDEIAEVLELEPADAAADALVRAALARGATDNVTAVVVGTGAGWPRLAPEPG